jgi:Flp pilus assembly protein TadG
MKHCRTRTPAGSCPPQKNLRPDVSGSVMLEFVIAFPLVLVLMFACIQFSQIWIARMVVHYGAYCAARSALVCHADEYSGENSAPSTAARAVCDLLRQTDRDTQNWFVPTGERSQVTVADYPKWNVTATSKYTLSLITPVVGQIIAWGMNPWATDSKGNIDVAGWDTKVSGNIDSLGYPTIVLTEQVTLPKPYVTMVRANLEP